MCLGQNSAHHAVHYLNAQLGALWENSIECVKLSGHGLKPLDRVRYDFALAEFHVGTKQRSKLTTKDGLMFSAVFSKPRLEFVCNHEAVLYLKIREGHFNLDVAKVESSAFVPNRARNVQLHDMEVALRLKFSTNGIRGHTSQIGNGTHIIQLLVLDFNTAKLVSKVAVAGGGEALAFYIHKYLDFLHHAGHHVLFSLPDFDDDRLDVLIDYSLEPHTVRNLAAELDEVCGVSLEEINRSLSSKWLKAIMDAADGAARNAVCLAEYRSTWTELRDHSDVQFHIRFGAPRVTALCQREVVLYFKIDELLVYDGHDFSVTPKHTYADWEIAVVVDLVKEVEGSFNRVKLDMTTIRFSDHFSKFHGLELSVDFAITLKATVVDFIDHYVSVLETAHFHIIYSVDLSRTETPALDTSDADTDAEPWAPVGHPSPGTRLTQVEIIKKTHTCGFDSVQVISQQAVVEHFRVLWQLSREAKTEHGKILGKWSYEDDFNATFGALKIRYLSNGKAIVWVHLDEGVLKPLGSSKTCQFAEWSIAFEVSFKLVEHTDVVASSKSWFTRFTESFAWKQYGSREQCTLKHLCLDFSTAHFVYELSKFEGLHLANRSAIESLKGAVHYLQEHYFKALTQHGHHVLQSVPIWKTGSTPPPVALTALTFQIYSKRVVDRHNCLHVSPSFEIVLVLLGMTAFRPLPSTRLEYSTEWIVRNRRSISYGTVCLSRKVFLEERLLALLARVNATTTVVPVFPGSQNANDHATIFAGHEGGEWGLALTTWSRRSLKTKGGCHWELVAGTESDYKWDHTDKWSYEHAGSCNDKRNGAYVISCRTKNHLHLPSSFQHGSLDIVLGGETDIELGFKGASTHWNSKAAAKWSVTLSMTSLLGGTGMSIDVKGDTKPSFVASRIHGEAPLEKLLDLNALHALVRVDLDELVAELRQTFGGIWEHCFPGMQAYSLCNPAFNAAGDILFELRPWVPRSQQPPTVSKARPSKAAAKKNVSDGTVDAHAPLSRPTPLRRPKSLLQKIGDGIRGAGRAVGDVIEDAFDGDSSDDEKSKSKMESKTASASHSSVKLSNEAQELPKISTQQTSSKVTFVHETEKTTIPLLEVKKTVTQPQNGKSMVVKANGNGTAPVASPETMSF